MKKLTCIFPFLLLALTYFSCSAPKQSFFFQDVVAITESAAGRLLLDSNQRQKWWPEIKTSPDESEKCSFRIKQFLLTGFDATLQCDGDSAAVQLLVRDSTKATATSIFQWQVTPLTNWNKTELEQTVRSLHEKMKAYFGNQVNVYGRTIKQELVTDTVLTALKKTFTQTPTSADVYKMIDAVRGYVQSNGGTERSYPMLNVFQEGPTSVQVMVGIPTTQALPANGSFLLRRLIPGHILVTEIKGGPAAIAAAQKQMEIYIADHKKSSPAIPYQSLITDRRAQPDTSQWITRLYYPVFF